MDFKSLKIKVGFLKTYLKLNMVLEKKEDNIYEVYYESEGKFMCIVFISMFIIFFIIMLIISLEWK